MSDHTKTALVLGAGGFIGSHMATRLKSEGYWVRGVDIKDPEYSPTSCVFTSLANTYVGKMGCMLLHIYLLQESAIISLNP